MATKKALEKAYDAGQAAQAGGFPNDGNPFEAGSEEEAAWTNGYSSELAEKWQTAGRRITVTIEEDQ